MKAALIQAPSSYRGREAPPFSIACLAGYVRGRGHEAACFDLNNGFYQASSPELRRMWDPDRYSFWESRDEIERLLEGNRAATEAFVRRILDTGAPVIGFATQTTSFMASLALAERIKRADPKRLIVFGGYQCSREQSALHFAADPRVDAVVLGEGEETLVELLDGLGRTGRLSPIPGLLLRGADGRIIDSGDRPPLMDFDAMPFPDYSDFAEEIRAGVYSDPHRLDVLDGRSCVRRCEFCTEWQYWGKFRSRSGKRIFEEIRHQLSLHPSVRHFYFTGLLVNGNLKELSRFCDLVVESGLKFTWSGQAIVQPGMDRAMLRKMAAAGCKWLGYGIESGSQELRWRLAKKFTDENAVSALRATKAAGIGTQINIMFGAPTETREDFERTLDFMKRVRPDVDSVLASQSFCTMEQNTNLYKKSEKFGVTGREHHLYWKSNDGANDYPERMRRYEEFCRLALSLGLPETSGVLARKPDKWLLLGAYYRHERDYLRAVACYRRSVRLERDNADVRAELAACYDALGRSDKAREWGTARDARS